MGYYDTDKIGENYSFNVLNKDVYPLLEWIPNTDFKSTMRLNSLGIKKYPTLKKQIFLMEQVEQFVFATGLVPFETSL
jgi:hypothetical protein